MRRPLGVILVAALTAASGSLALLYAALLFLISSATKEVALPGLSMVASYMAATALVIGVLAFILTIGLWSLKRWAWPLTVGLAATLLALALLSLDRAASSSSVAIIATSGLVLLYFCLPHVRRAFGWVGGFRFTPKLPEGREPPTGPVGAGG
jgi:uncharacterized membrane protein (DUF2068 family)